MHPITAAKRQIDTKDLSCVLIYVGFFKFLNIITEEKLLQCKSAAQTVHNMPV